MTQRGVSRRTVLKGLGLGGGAAAAVPLLNSCVVVSAGSTGTGGGSAADEVNGPFDWRRAKGTTIRILQTNHPYQQAFAPMLKEFTELTGVEVVPELVDENNYFTKLNTELAGGSGTHDVFMTGAYFLWQYGPPGWVENLTPWLQNSSATSDEYDFEDIYPGLRSSTRWDFKSNQLGFGGQWAIPWGFETNVVCYNKRLFDQRGIKPAETLDELVELANDLTAPDRSRYGISFRGSKSWATIHPGFMTMFSREGCQDYTVEPDGSLRAAMNSSKAVELTKTWAELAKTAGPAAWTTYDYPNCTTDLGNGVAAMVFDADSATYPKNKQGGSAEAGNLAWHPGPKGPDGNLRTNLWTWSLAMNSASKHKLAAWLFIQWATGKQAISQAIKGVAAGGPGAFADPPRKSVFEGAFSQTLGSYPGYLDTFQAVIDDTSIQFTPQKKFFDTTEEWAVALQRIYNGADAKATLDELAAASTQTVNGK